ncbi:MAG: hypothetical protein GXO08_00500 [Aquificae bacterium]|nr:hypothetical protein [Aquificota bacterium]
MEWLFLLLLLWVLFFEVVYPWGVFEVEDCPKEEREPRTENQRSFVLHVHTQFSYDSLGKPEELEEAARRLGISRVFITDHENDLFKEVVKPASRDLFSVGVEFQDPRYGRLLALGNGLFVVAHPNHGKKDEYRWRGNYPENFLYELVDLKDALVRANPLVKLHLAVRFLLLYPLLGLRALDYFPRLVPVKDWVLLYLERTGGRMPVAGGLDHHVKFSFWEKPKKSLSFPPYLWSFYLLQNRTFGDEPEEALKRGRLYLSFCGERISLENGRVPVKGKVLTVNFFRNGGIRANLCGRVERGAAVSVLYRYLFRVKGLFFGLRPAVLLQFPKGR